MMVTDLGKKQNKESVLAFCTVFAVIVVGSFISWAINCGVVFLFCMRFGFNFNLNTTSIIWLVLVLVGYIFKQSKDVLR